MQVFFLLLIDSLQLSNFLLVFFSFFFESLKHLVILLLAFPICFHSIAPLGAAVSECPHRMSLGLECVVLLSSQLRLGGCWATTASNWQTICQALGLVANQNVLVMVHVGIRRITVVWQHPWLLHGPTSHGVLLARMLEVSLCQILLGVRC